jgi:D-alanine-D-alanine ligase
MPRMARKLRVAVVFGGRSAEHEVSVASARTVLEAIDRDRYDVVLLGIDREGRWRLGGESLRLLESAGTLPTLERSDAEVALVPRGSSNALVDLAANRDLGAVDVVFPVLHGPYGEDGSIQGLCRLANIPCVGAGVLGSAVGMDKDVMKRLLAEAGIPTARHLLLRRGGPAVSFAEAAGRLGAPVFVKPANLGSSVGVSKAQDAGEYARAVETAFRYDTKVLVEEAIAGRELECSVLGNEQPAASVPGEVLPTHEFYDYDAKYIDENGAALEIPARLAAETVERVRALAVRAFTTLCCSGMARVDLFLRPDGQLLVNEINTIPGFTRISMYPKLWEASGLPYPRLIDRLIELAIERHGVEQGLATTPAPRG